jgi:hypothetical protein
MKGLVLTFFEDMVIEDFGMECWTDLLNSTGLDGIYTAAQNYPDEEIVTLVTGLSDSTGIGADKLVRIFGNRMFPKFHERYPQFIDGKLSLLEFLSSVNDVIHMEVLKLYPEAALPHFEYEWLNTETLLMKYRSKRKLCGLAIGLIEAAAENFGTSCQIEHDPCILHGADYCGIKVSVRS